MTQLLHKHKLLAVHLIVFCILLFCVFQFAEEIISVKQAIYYALFPEPTVSEINARYTLHPMEAPPDVWFEDPPLIQHAGGQIDGYSYTNSAEAIENSLSRGENFIEIDFSYTSDAQLVCAHYWSDAMPEDEIPTLEQFLSTKVQGKFTSLSGQMLIDIMRQNPEMHLITDVKNKDLLIPVVTDLVQLAEHDPELLNRIIIQLYTSREKSDVQAIYPFDDTQFIFTIYQWGRWSHEVAAICNEENIFVITLGQGGMPDEDAALMQELGFTVYEFTLNRIDHAQQALDRGISSLYTDNLLTSDLIWPDKS